MARKRIEPITVRATQRRGLRPVASFAPITNAPELNLTGAKNAEKLQKALSALRRDAESIGDDYDARQDNLDKKAAHGQFFIDQMALSNAKEFQVVDGDGELTDGGASEEEIRAATAARFNAQSYMWKTTYATLQGENAATESIANLNSEMEKAAASGDLEALEGMQSRYKQVRGELFLGAEGNQFYTGGATSQFRVSDQNFPTALAAKIRTLKAKKMGDEVALNASNIYGRSRDATKTRDEDASQKLSEVNAKIQTLVATGVQDGVTARTQLVDLTIHAAENNGDHIQGGAFIDALLRGSQNGTLVRADGQPLRLTDKERDKLKDAKDKLVDDFYKDQERSQKISDRATSILKNNLENLIYEKLSNGETIDVGSLKELIEKELTKPEYIGTGARYNLGALRNFITGVDTDIDKAQFNKRFPNPEDVSILMGTLFEQAAVRVDKNKNLPDEKMQSGAAIHSEMVKANRLPPNLATQLYTEIKRLESSDENWNAAVQKIRPNSEKNSIFGSNPITGRPTDHSKRFSGYYNEFIRLFIGDDFTLSDGTKLKFRSTRAALRLDQEAVSYAINKMWQSRRLQEIENGPPDRRFPPYASLTEKEFEEKTAAWTSRGLNSNSQSPAELWNFVTINHTVNPETTPPALKAIIDRYKTPQTSESLPAPVGAGTGSGTGANADSAATDALNSAIGDTASGSQTPTPSPTSSSNEGQWNREQRLEREKEQAEELRDKKIEEAVKMTDLEGNRNNLSVLDITQSVTGIDGEIIRRLKPEFVDRASAFVNGLISQGVISNDAPLDVIEDIVSKFYGAEGLFDRNPDWAEEAAKQIQNITTDVRGD